MPVEHLKLKPLQLETLMTWLDDQIQTIRERRDARVRQWIKWRRQYEGKVGPKNFPWKGASNVFVPQTAIDVDAIHANMMSRIFDQDRVWEVKALTPAEKVGINPQDNQPITWRDLADAMQEYMELESGPTGVMDVYESLEEAILECVKLGTAIEYNPWITDVQEDYVYSDIDGSANKEESVTLFDGLRPQVIPLEDFLVVPNYSDIHGPKAAPLFGHQYWLRKGQVIARVREGKYRITEESDEFETIMGSPGAGDSHSATQLKDEQSRLEHEGGSFIDDRREDYLFEDLWCRVQLEPGGVEFKLYITRHAVSGTVIGVRPWPYKTAPYHVMRYVRREGRFYGIGVPEMLETIQHGINTTFNQSVDNATIANMRCIKVKQGSHAARSFSDVYPGKKFFVGNMDEIEAFQLGEIYPSAFQVGLNLRDFGERRTGINDPNLGKDSPGDGTATTTMALLQESSRRFDLYAKDIRRAVGAIGMQSLELIAQHKPISRVFATMAPHKAQLVEAALSTGARNDIREQLKVTATSASGSANKEVQRQSAVTVFGLVTQYLEKLTQLTPLLINQEIPPEMRQFFYEVSQLGERAMQRILKSFDMPDLASDLPQTEKLLNAQPQQAQGTDPNAGPVGSPDGVPDNGAGDNPQALAPAGGDGGGVAQ